MEYIYYIIIGFAFLVTAFIYYTASFVSVEETKKENPDKAVPSYETLHIFYDLLKEYASLGEIITIRKKRKQRVSDLIQKQETISGAISKLHTEVSTIVNLNHKIITEHNSYYVVELLKKL